ncbi:DUF2768 domain-containing protein [Halalkalibacterium halodurans]|jgi:uncharacterized membrane protein|uniref:BH1643 protein n=2 Tax=Halalkalibacterium halodurans TaxID=86665 RepID=Q9KCD0_HALH5|nr:DUF2768 domain-containing protein [Halalkalibacterium halodurans]MDY7222214.1 DUF2768 domain-containing protein [Halalkalibacterium halodurans]MDY7241435.1 DUF2768 domain-containing protein [Halalkalibacterium halodurans]MED3646720.1 DUF2768 domain-containing protein [Halalkalibacterium halodurans]MED4081380.1 DUF2768 domain-containing protein [Halalkalibacterium halodurans]MED4086919.1 DUF2768 domain-containing protein [Halalkalibacterium halodurans]
MSDAMMNMWISFIGLFLMFVSVVTAIVSREKLSGFLQKVVLVFSFLCLVVSGLIVFYIVIGGPTSTHGS